MKARCVALLGRRDEPTDAVEEYCQFLGAALEAQGISFEIERVSWDELGWRKALAGMEQRTENWKEGLGPDSVHRPRLVAAGLSLRLFEPRSIVAEARSTVRRGVSRRPALRRKPPCRPRSTPSSGTHDETSGQVSPSRCADHSAREG